VWPDAATRLRSARNEIAERDDVGVEVVGEQGEVGGSTLFGRDLPPAVVLPALRVAEADELDVRAVGSDDQRVVRYAVGVDAAGNPDFPHPDPPPFTTIAWRLVHVSECKLMYHEYAFGRAKLTFPDINSAHTTKDAIAQLEQGHALLQHDLLDIDDARLDREVLTNWGEKWPAWRTF